jgi:hypothetical protein
MGSDKLVLFSFQNDSPALEVTEAKVATPKEPRPTLIASPASPELIKEKTNNSKNGVGKMDVMKMLLELRQEREHIEEAILTLERLVRGRGKRRGRPPAWMKEVKRRGRPPGSKNKAKDMAAS